MSIQIKLKNSVVQDSTPSTSDLPVVGELALNANINSIGGFMRASDNTIVKIFGPGSVTTPTATTTVSGIAELATNTETTTGTATNRVVTPAGLKTVTDAERATSNTNYVAKAGSTLTGVLTMPNGSNSAPAINFGDSDSGIFGGTNTVSLAAGGTTRLTANTGVDVTGTLAVTGAITTTSDLFIPDKLIHSGDTDTAVRFPAADTVSVETGGSEAIRVDSSQRLLIGTSSARTPAAIAPILQVEGTSSNTTTVSITRNSANNDGGRFIFNKSRGASNGSDVVVQNGDTLGQIVFCANDGTDSDSISASILSSINGTPGANDVPGKLVFSTTADGAASPTTRLTIDSTGTSTFAGNVDCSAGLDVTGATTGTTSGTDVGLTITQNGSGNILNLYDGGNLVFKVNSVGNPTVTSTNPVYASTNSSSSVTTTLFSNSSGQGVLQTNSGSDLIFGTGAVEKVRITSSGLVGIATSSPAQRLHVYGNSGFTAIAVGDNSTTEPYLLLEADETNNLCSLHSRTNNSLTFKINNSERMRIDTAGRLGLGTSSPDGQLHVFSNSAGSVTAANDANDLVVESTANVGMSFLTANDSLARIKFGDPDSNGIGAIVYSHVADSMQFNTAGSQRLTIDSSGNIGIGTGAPGAPLEIFAANNGITHPLAAKQRFRFRDNDSTSTTGQPMGTIEWFSNDSGNSSGIAAYISCLGADTSGSGTLIFATGNNLSSSNTSERMRIDSSGNVGIGTNSPESFGGGYKTLEVAGSTDTNGGVFKTATSGAAGSGTGGREMIMFTDTDGGSINVTTAHVLKFSTANTERMRINSSGIVGIGTSSPEGKGLDVTVSRTNGYAATSDTRNLANIICRNSSDAPGRFAALSFINGGGTQAEGSINLVQTGNYNGDLAFKLRTAVSTWTENMRIKSDGKVGIGTESPDQTLHVHKGSAGTIDSTSSSVLTLENSDNAILQFLCPNNKSAQLRFGDPQDDGAGYIDYDHSQNRLSFGTAGPERMRIDSSGNIGIGTSSPQRTIHQHVANSSANYHQFTNTATGSAGGDGGLVGIDANEDLILWNQEVNTIRFGTSNQERMRISTEGFVSIGNTSAAGSRLFVSSAGVSQNTLRLEQAHSSALVQFSETTNASYVGDGYKYHGFRSAASNYNFMAFDSAHASTPDREFTIRGDGNAFADGTWNNNGADYAEFFESSTGSAIPVGTAVVLDNNKVRAATSSDAVGNIIGVVRPKEPGQASMTIGNTAWNKWQGKYLTDDFDRFILDEHNVINWTDADGTFHSYESHAIPSDVTVPSDAETLTKDINGDKFTHYRLNPDYDSSKTYVPRSDRDEWVIVGLVGQVKVLKGQAVNDRWIKMKDVSDTVEEYFIR